ncbi:hypothetical protein ACIBSV_49245 [Embleya sp. NPDC050154]|uniref:hypothetical protein n=1 Tax=Embleya sp. NPDC050154 TaxID=3363988 RepID=UPI0037A4DE3A
MVLEKKFGANWATHVFTDDQLAKIQEIREEETRKRTRRGVAAVPTDPLVYAQFFQITRFIEKYWEDLQPALGPHKKEMGALLARFEALRNSVAHSRELLPFEQDLLSGISGEIRNKVTIYMSSQDPAGNYFARIETVTDGFGHVVEFHPIGPFALSTNLVLRPGDTVTYQCRGTDPQGRTMRWWLETDRKSGRGEPVYGNDVELTWTVADHHISSFTDVYVVMATDASYHRFSRHDGIAHFVYCVLPRETQQPQAQAG